MLLTSVRCAIPLLPMPLRPSMRQRESQVKHRRRYKSLSQSRQKPPQLRIFASGQVADRPGSIFVPAFRVMEIMACAARGCHGLLQPAYTPAAATHSFAWLKHTVATSEGLMCPSTETPEDTPITLSCCWSLANTRFGATVNFSLGVVRAFQTGNLDHVGYSAPSVLATHYLNDNVNGTNNEASHRKQVRGKAMKAHKHLQAFQRVSSAVGMYGCHGAIV